MLSNINVLNKCCRSKHATHGEQTKLSWAELMDSKKNSLICDLWEIIEKFSERNKIYIQPNLWMRKQPENYITKSTLGKCNFVELHLGTSDYEF